MQTAVVWLTPADRALECVRTLQGGGVEVLPTAAGNAYEAVCGCGHVMVALSKGEVLEAMKAHSDYKGQQ